MAKKPLTPEQAKTYAQVCTLASDGMDGKTWWALIDNPGVVLQQQRSGEASTGRVVIPRREFARLCRWYLTGRTR